MTDNKEIVVIPCNDHAIFFDEFGVLRERIGIAWKKDKDCLEKLDNQYYISEEGHWNLPAGENDDFEYSPIIAHRGETVPFENLRDIFGYTRYISSVIPDLKGYDVHIDKSNMTGSLKVFIDYDFYEDEFPDGGCSSYELTVETDKEVLVMSLLESLRFTNLGLENRDVDVLGTMKDYLVPFLIEYCKLMSSKFEFGIFFRKSTSSDADLRKDRNRIICEDEKKYLGLIRKFVKEEFEKEWNNFLDREYQKELYKKKHDEWQQEAASEYDRNPNLME